MDLEEAWTKEQELLNAQLKIARAVLDHAGEKGSSLEGHVRNFLRQCLPQQYGITTGFIAYPPPQLGGEPSISKQLDIIIYDAMISAPLISFPTCDVLPLEGVLGYVEVKARLSSLSQCVKEARDIRRNHVRWFHVATGPNHSLEVPLSLAPRSYVFVFEWKGKQKPSAALSNASKRHGEHAELSGLYVGNAGFFRTKPNKRPQAMTIARGANALTAFRIELQHDLARARNVPGTPVLVRQALPDGSVREVLGSLSAPYLNHYAPRLLRKKLAKAHAL